MILTKKTQKNEGKKTKKKRTAIEKTREKKEFSRSNSAAKISMSYFEVYFWQTGPKEESQGKTNTRTFSLPQRLTSDAYLVPGMLS